MRRMRRRGGMARMKMQSSVVVWGASNATVMEA